MPAAEGREELGLGDGGRARLLAAPARVDWEGWRGAATDLPACPAA
jgi:hypothetical protein